MLLGHGVFIVYSGFALTYWHTDRQTDDTLAIVFNPCQRTPWLVVVQYGHQTVVVSRVRGRSLVNQSRDRIIIITRLHPFACAWLYNATAVRGALW